MKKEICFNCERPLTLKNIQLALAEANLPQNELLFFCPSYGPSVDLDGDYDCNGTAGSDTEKPAYWQTTPDAVVPRESGD